MPRQPGPGPHNSQSAPGPRSARLPAASRHQSRPCPTAARSHGSLTPRLPVPAARSRLQPLFHFGRSSQLRLRRPLPTAARSQLRRGPVPRGPDPTAAGSHGGRIPQQPDPTAAGSHSQVPQQPGPSAARSPTAAGSHSSAVPQRRPGLAPRPSHSLLLPRQVAAESRFNYCPSPTAARFLLWPDLK